MRLLRAHLGKLRRRPASWVTLALLLALLGLIFLALIAAARTSPDPQAALGARLFVTFPGAYELVLTLILGIGGLLAVTYGAAIAGTEWTWGTLKNAVARGESRTRYTLLNYLAVAICTWIGLLIAFLLGVVAAAIGAVILGASLDGLTDPDGLLRLPEVLGRAALALAMNAAFGYAVATLARSQLAGIGVGVGLFFAEGIAGIFLPQVFQWFPFSASSAVTSPAAGAGLGGGAAAGLVTQLDPNTAVLAVIAWLVAALAVTAIFTERAEISG
ncbi:MAG TPA: ABC transporter permease [Candidatus Limnocylindrales bacterium]|nr:ABC transporter permease [Candidatus Limnocylindrales bacterium]